ncbi:putative histidine kinase M3EDp [Mariannaea sp. PMI_226]|nr:putative histidine kinase M3EDp [Mariannaea sp. PMI_226]
MSRPCEPQREREVQRYFQSWKVARGSSLNVALNVDNIALVDLHGTGYKPHASSDKALTAFAQLAVFRLNVKRAMVSLLDASTQIVLAEATRDLCLGDLDTPTKAAQGTAVNDNTEKSSKLVGASVVSRAAALDEHCLTNRYVARNSAGQSYEANGLVVPNCRLDPRFKNRPYVQAEPGIRFYAGVPIVSRNGHKIGVYSVSAEEPRSGLSIEELKFMQGVAQAVMEHLEWGRDRVDRFKGERIVRGLATFIEDCQILSDECTLMKDDQSKKPSPTRPTESKPITRRYPLSRSNSYQPGTEPTPGLNSSKADCLSIMYHRAAQILRSSTLADGVVFFGSTTTTTRQMSHAMKSGGLQPAEDDDAALQVTSGSESLGVDSSDSDTSPSGRPCKILAYSLADARARADIEQGSALSLGTLERYFSLFPKGRTFSFTEEGSGISSEDSASDREPVSSSEISEGQKSNTGIRRRVKMDHKELLKKISGVKSLVFVPLFDYTEDRLAGGCFLWTSVCGRMMNLDNDLSYLRAFGNSIMSQVGRIKTQRNEAAKTTFIASMSHELRSPLHGILGAAEFLKDATTDNSYQSGLIASISTCGKTLLDTLNHILDYSKINKLGRLQMRRAAKQNKPTNFTSDSLESLNMTTVVDLAALVEEVVDVVTAGHNVKQLSSNGLADGSKLTTYEASGLNQSTGTGNQVSVLLDISRTTSWMVKTQPGALRRIIMNLFGNALKYTYSGFIVVSLRAQESTNKEKVNALIRVVDTGKGMSEEFQQERLFVPFSQEDSFQSGTGLGLSIVRQIVDSLGGSLQVKSQQHIGTAVNVRVRLEAVLGHISHPSDEAVASISKRTRGLKLVLLEEDGRCESPRAIQQFRKLSEIIAETCSQWFDMRVAKADGTNTPKADVYMCCGCPSVQMLQRRFGNLQKNSFENKKTPIIIVCLNAEEAVRIAQSQMKLLAGYADIVELVPQPCGPRKLAKALRNCMKRAEGAAQNSPPSVSEPTRAEQQYPDQQKNKNVGDQEMKPDVKGNQPESVLTPQPNISVTPSTTVEHAQKAQTKESVHGTGRRVLLVDDNKINLQLLVMFMKKCGFSYEEAENGQEALDKFKEASTVDARVQQTRSSRGFDFVLMDISMPVMNGIESTKRIREFERENWLQRTNIIALTGLASIEAQRDAKSAGVDVYFPKPVRFAELKKLLTAS